VGQQSTSRRPVTDSATGGTHGAGGSSRWVSTGHTWWGCPGRHARAAAASCSIICTGCGPDQPWVIVRDTDGNEVVFENQVRAALIPEEAAEFDQQWREVMARATETLDLSEVLATLESWRRWRGLT
jgi:hypothetical protein